MTEDACQLWRGTRIAPQACVPRLPELGRQLAADLSLPLPMDALLLAADRLGRRLRRGALPALPRALEEAGLAVPVVQELLASVAVLLGREALEARLSRQLGSRRPGAVSRPDLRSPLFEGWAPLGVLVHVASEQAPVAAALSVLEGLLAGNINLLEASARGGGFALALLEALLAEDPTGSLAPFVHAFRLPDSRDEVLGALLAQADGVVAWGDAEAVGRLHQRAPASARLLARCTGLDLGYVAPTHFEDAATWERMARQALRPGLLGPAAPTCCLLDTDDAAVVEACALRLEAEVTRLASEPWRVRTEARLSGTAPVPSRTLWMRPLPRSRVIAELRPLRASLGTVSLACALEDLGALSTLLFQAGAARLVEPGAVHDLGELHDGVHALCGYSRRVVARPGGPVSQLASLAELVAPSPAVLPAGTPVLTKEGFQKQEFDLGMAQVYFKSGGSSAEPTLSAFSYRDYEDQMRAMAEGLLAAGVEPARDRCMNLFFAGNLYGSFLSFFSILEHLGAVQFPMVALPDLELVARTILRYRVNTLFGMSSYLVQLMRSQADLFKADPVVTKLFYAGEHMGKTQMELLRRDFGVEVIRSASYGSNDAGPLGFACPHGAGGVHHLLATSQHLEILRMEEDLPVQGLEVGRLVFTSRLRSAQRVERYEIGDLGRWVSGACPCGRKQPRFELMGRFGDVFRAAGLFFNHRKFAHILEDRLGYAGLLQIRLAYRGPREVITLRLEEGSGLQAPQILDWLGRDDESVKHSIRTLGVADLEVEFAPPSAFVHSAHSGKLRPILDDRGA